jgi:colanic acid biosynthesis protein WcaH
LEDYNTVGLKINKIIRIVSNDPHISLKLMPRFIDIFEHFYDDSIYQDVSIHYINLAYEIKIEETLNLPGEQHNEYQWLTIDELIKSKQVHKHRKDYFKD